jgi:hypothetical protein
MSSLVKYTFTISRKSKRCVPDRQEKSSRLIIALRKAIGINTKVLLLERALFVSLTKPHVCFML